MLSTAVPIVRNGRTVGALEVEQSLDAVHGQVRKDVLALIGIGGSRWCSGSASPGSSPGSIARPLRSLGEAARRRAAGDTGGTRTGAGLPRAGPGGREFNEMADRLDAVLESQRAFVADASHQLRTPLTGLRLRLEAAGVKTDDPAVAEELEAAERESARLEGWSDLLALASSEQPAEDERADLADAARDASERWRGPADEAGHEIPLDGEARCIVRAGETELAAILDNLIENALKYSPRGSTVTVEMRSSENGTGRLGVLSESGPIDTSSAAAPSSASIAAAAAVRGHRPGAADRRRPGPPARRHSPDRERGRGCVRAEVVLPAETLPTPNPRASTVIP